MVVELKDRKKVSSKIYYLLINFQRSFTNKEIFLGKLHSLWSLVHHFLTLQTQNITIPVGGV